VRPVKGCARQPCLVCVSLADLNLRQGVPSDEAARKFNKMGTAFNAKN
jgi:hypothetical protein